jgi:hypothetical protein
MAMPALLEEWWREHPERWSQRHRHARGFPAEGSLEQQIDWFRRRFLKLADEASSIKDQHARDVVREEPGLLPL